MLNIKVRLLFSFGEPFNTNETQLKWDNPSNIQALLNKLCDSDKRRKKIFDSSGELLPDIIILRNGKHITSLNGIKTELQNGDDVAIFRPVGGG